MSRYIDIEAFDDWHDDGYDLYASYEALHNAPSIDIVRCKECKYYEADWCYWRDEAITADDFCSYGEREGE